jgi:CAAX protease family protein
VDGFVDQPQGSEDGLSARSRLLLAVRRSLWWRLAIAFALYLVLANGFLVVYLVATAGPLTPDEAGRAALEAELATPRFLAVALGFQALAGCLATWFMTRKVDRRALGDLGLGGSAGIRPGDMAWGGLMGAVLAAVVTLFISALAGRHLRLTLFSEEGGNPWVSSIPLLLVFSAFVEEWFFRGYLYVNLRERYRTGGAILMSSIAFSLLHASNPGAGALAGINVFLVGVVLVELREITHGLQVSFGLHLGWNLALGMGFGVPVSGYTLPSVLRVSLTDLPPAFGGGEFGVEASAVLTVLFTGIALLLAWRLGRDQDGEAAP